jgi:hypothetical protein
MKPILFVIAIAVIVLVINLYLKHERTEKMKGLAQRRGLEFLGRWLPAEYVGQPRPSPALYSGPRNVIFGKAQDGDLILAYDTDMPKGRKTYSMTVVARRWQTFPPLTPRPDSSLRSFDTGHWRSVYLDWGWFSIPQEMSTDTIERVWKLMETHAATSTPCKPGASAATEVVLHPRKRLN